VCPAGVCPGVPTTCHVVTHLTWSLRRVSCSGWPIRLRLSEPCVQPNQGGVVTLEYNHEQIVWEPAPPPSMQHFYRAFLRWRAEAGMDNTLADRLADLYTQCGFVDIVSTPQHEVGTRNDPVFLRASASGLRWPPAAAIRWWQMTSSRRRNGLRLKRSIVPGSTIAPWPRPCI
jgi:hypothetical protein